jgi:hypothetical protein
MHFSTETTQHALEGNGCGIPQDILKGNYKFGLDTKMHKSITYSTFYTIIISCPEYSDLVSPTMYFANKLHFKLVLIPRRLQTITCLFSQKTCALKFEDKVMCGELYVQVMFLEVASVLYMRRSIGAVVAAALWKGR